MSIIESIEIRGAKVHNLKNISLKLPRDQLIVFTGLSGSGKSSLAFDTIYAEGQRRYIESLSTYARQFLDQMEKPDVEWISGLSPTISIEQKTSSYNPRSTVGTVTEIYDYLRVLYTRIAKPYCWNCGGEIQAQSPQKIIDTIFELPLGTKVSVLSPIAREKKGTFQKELDQLRQSGFSRIRLNGETCDLGTPITLDKNKKHNLDVYIDRLIIKEIIPEFQARVSDAVDLALKTSEGTLILELETSGKKQDLFMSEKLACTSCEANVNYNIAEPRTFSFNSPIGACPKCDGLGFIGSQEEGALPHLEDDGEITEDLDWSSPEICPSCQGARLKKESLGFKINKKNIFELCELSVDDLYVFFNKLPLNKKETLICERLLSETKERLEFLQNVGSGYLTLSRTAQTLSGGESQRIRLASQIGSSLVGVIYVLDEPSIGLHPRDHDRLIQTLEKLRDLGNTVIVVEHDKETIEKADYLVDLGPGAGIHGGTVVYSGTIKDLKKAKMSLTAQYLIGKLKIEARKNSTFSYKNSKKISIKNASKNNLKNVSIEIPMGAFTCITGVSGSGKSSLIIDTLYPALLKKLYKVKTDDLEVDEISSLEEFDKVIDVDQSPIGRTPRSNPSTYTGLFSVIRQIFASLPEAKIRGYTPGRFSFNVKAGRCETCQGGGLRKIEMHFLPNVYVKCEECQGKRYNRETLEILYKGKNISEVLDLSIEEASDFFSAIPALSSKLKTLNDVGLGYLRLGQSATTLSGGEAQRMKLARELCKRGTGKTLYILDEPSTGLHFEDIKKLLFILHTLTEQGNTVIVIEHNLDIIKVSDYIFDLGPEGGPLGGKIVAQGTPLQISQNSKSITGQYLKNYL